MARRPETRRDTVEFAAELMKLFPIGEALLLQLVGQYQNFRLPSDHEAIPGPGPGSLLPFLRGKSCLPSALTPGSYCKNGHFALPLGRQLVRWPKKATNHVFDEASICSSPELPLRDGGRETSATSHYPAILSQAGVLRNEPGPTTTVYNRSYDCECLDWSHKLGRSNGFSWPR